jgi:hypothetical protein
MLLLVWAGERAAARAGRGGLGVGRQGGGIGE